MPVLGKVGLINRGEYSATAQYTPLDFVMYNGSTYVAVKNVTGVTPSDADDHWQVMALGTSMSLVNSLDHAESGEFALDAAQGPILANMINGKAPTNHASTDIIYGKGNGTNFGHVKLSDVYSSIISGANAAGGVGASQNALYNLYNGLVDGTIVPNKATNLAATHADGVYTDQYGSFIHGSTSANNWWAIKKHDLSDIFRFYFETGKFMANGRTIVRGPGDTASLVGVIAGGFLTSSQTRVAFSVPLLTTTGLTAKITELSVTFRHAGGGYPYMCYGSSNNQYVQIGSSSVSIWANSKSVHTNGVAAVGCTIRESWLDITIDFKNTLRTNAGTTNVINNTPMSVTADLTVSFT